jgi:hypothetical protein
MLKKIFALMVLYGTIQLNETATCKPVTTTSSTKQLLEG